MSDSLTSPVPVGAPPPAARPPRSRVDLVGAVRRHRRALASVLVAVGLVIVSAAAVQLLGLRWFVVESPSMGRAAPVGTLVVTAPVAVDHLRVGEVVTFRPPSAERIVYTHRVVAIGADGGVRTRGDINGSRDPWTLHQSDLVGLAVAVVPGLGWLLRAAPALAGGVVALVLLTGLIPWPAVRTSARLLGSSALIAAVSTALRPFADVQVLTTEHVGRAADVLLVSTGLLPVRAQVHGGGAVDLISGQVARVPLHVRSDGRYLVSTELHLEPWGWVLLCLLWLVPLLWVLVVGVPAEASERSA